MASPHQNIEAVMRTLIMSPDNNVRADASKKRKRGSAPRRGRSADKEWLRGAYVRWMSKTLKSSANLEQDSTWTRVKDVLVFLSESVSSRGTHLQIPVSVGKILLKKVCSVAADESADCEALRCAQQVLLAATGQTFFNLKESAEIVTLAFQNVDASAAAKSERVALLLAALRGHRVLLQQQANPRKCFVGMVESALFSCVVRLLHMSNERSEFSEVAAEATGLLRDVLGHKDIVDGYESACTQGRSTKRRKLVCYQRRLFERLRAFVEESAATDGGDGVRAATIVVLPTMLRVVGASATIFLELAAILLPRASTCAASRAGIAKLVDAFVEAAPIAAAAFRRSDETASRLRASFRPVVDVAIASLPCPHAANTIRALLAITHLLIEPFLGQIMPTIVRSALDSSSEGCRSLCSALLDVYSRLRRLDHWLGVVVTAAAATLDSSSSSSSRIFGETYDAKLATALAKISESTVPALLDSLESGLVRAQPAVAHTFGLLVANVSVSPVTSTQLLERLRRLSETIDWEDAGPSLESRLAIGRAARVLCDRCAVFSGADPLRERKEETTTLDAMPIVPKKLLESSWRGSDTETIAAVRTAILRLRHIGDDSSRTKYSEAQTSALVDFLWSHLLRRPEWVALWQIVAPHLGVLCEFSPAKDDRIAQMVRNSLLRRSSRDVRSVLLASTSFFEIKAIRSSFAVEAIRRGRSLMAKKKKKKKIDIDELGWFVELLNGLPRDYYASEAKRQVFDLCADAEVAMRRSGGDVDSTAPCRRHFLLRPRLALGRIATDTAFLGEHDDDILTFDALRSATRVGVLDRADDVVEKVFRDSLEKCETTNAKRQPSSLALYRVAAIATGLADGTFERSQQRIDRAVDAKRSASIEGEEEEEEPVISAPTLSLVSRAETLASKLSLATREKFTFLSLTAALVSIRCSSSSVGSAASSCSSSLLSIILPATSIASQQLVARDRNEDGRVVLASAQMIAIVCRAKRQLAFVLSFSDSRLLLASVLAGLRQRRASSESIVSDTLLRALTLLVKSASVVELEHLFDGLFQELETADLSRSVVASRCLLAILRAPTLGGERGAIVAGKAVRIVERVRLLLRGDFATSSGEEKVREEKPSLSPSEEKGGETDSIDETLRLVVLDLVSVVLSRPRVIRLPAHRVSGLLEIAATTAHLRSSSLQIPSSVFVRAATTLIAAAQRRSRQLCCCLPVFVRFFSDLVRTVVESGSVEQARYVLRVCELVLEDPLRGAFRHHVTGVLATYLAAVVRRATPLSMSLERALLPAVSSLLEICGRHELQQLHIALDAPARVLLKTLHKRYLREHKYSGNV
eukprot:g1345.t1